MAVTAVGPISRALISFPPPLIAMLTRVGPPWQGDVDIFDGGKYQVTGTVENTPNSPVFRKVTLFDQVSRLLIREQWSDPVTGVYTFKNIRAGMFFVVSVDHTSTYNAVITDKIVSELMP